MPKLKFAFISRVFSAQHVKPQSADKNMCDKRVGFVAAKNSVARFAMSMLLATVLCINLLGCVTTTNNMSTEQTPQIETTTVTQADLVNESKAKFGEDKYEYLPALENVSRDHTFEVELGFDPKSIEGIERNYQIMGIYVDSEFSEVALAIWNFEKTDTGYKAIITPPDIPLMCFTNAYVPPGGDEERISTAPQDNILLNKKDPYADWGNFPRYYKVQWLDFKTGEALEKPIVQIFTVQTELEAPESEMFVDDKGKLSLRWEPVDGAKGYLIATGEYSEESGMDTFFKTEDYLDASQTQWHAPRNNTFRTGYNITEWSYITPTVEGTTVGKEDTYTCNIVVIAVGENGNSAADKLHNTAAMASHLPYGEADETARSEGLNTGTNLTVATLPAQYPVLMCDGNIVYKTIRYDFETAGIYSDHSYEADGQLEDGTFINPRTVIRDNFKISYSLDKTNIFGTYVIGEYSKNWQEELAKIKERQDALGRAGLQDQIDERIGRIKTQDQGEDTDEGVDPGELQVIDTEIFATSAMGNYLATNLLAGKETIPMKDFPEAFDTEHLADVYNEVFYQNPLILGVEDVVIDNDMNVLVKYEDSQEERLKKQAEIQAQIEQIIPNIITNNMTAVEKEIAINEYLCNSLEYDKEAYESAAQTDFKVVDPKYNDTFTAYGALVKKVCVCAGYAAAFKLLADAAGLDAVVVTGTWAGGVGHAWNRVLVDGEWISVDSTNNDNPYLYNALFNLPDDVSGKVLVENEQYMADDMLDDYFAQNDANEYYKLMGDFYNNDQIVDQLVAGLADDGSVTLRTDYNLDDESLEVIISQVSEKSGHEKLYVKSLLGVITISTTA